MAVRKPGNQQKPIVRKLGKAKARAQFAPLVETLACEGGIVEITDYGKTAAVMLGYEDYMILLARAGMPFKPKRQLYGSAVLVGDLEEATREVSQMIQASLEKTISEL